MFMNGTYTQKVILYVPLARMGGTYVNKVALYVPLA